METTTSELTDNPAIDNNEPGISVINFGDSYQSAKDIIPKMQDASKWIRSITQDDDYSSTVNIFGKKDLPCHYSHDEVIAGYSAKGHSITIADAQRIIDRCAKELRDCDMLVKVVPHPSLSSTSE